MKKLLSTTACLLTLVMLYTPAQAKEKVYDDEQRSTMNSFPIYLSIGTGLTMTSDSKWSDPAVGSGSISIDNTENFSGAIGTSFLNNTRTELEVS